MDDQKRRSRNKRPPLDQQYQLTPRDEEVLYALGRMRIASTPQLAQLFFPSTTKKISEGTAARRLSKLLALNLVRVKVAALSRPNLYGLSEAGREWLASRDVNPERLHVWRPPSGYPNVEHDLAVGDVRVALTLACQRREGHSLVLFESDHDCRRFAGARTPEYVPDALVTLRTPAGERRYVVEVDHSGTQGRSAFARKAAAVRGLVEAHAPCWGLPWPWEVLLFAPSQTRLRGLARAAAAVGGAEWWLAGELELLRAPDLLAVPFKRLADLVESPVPTSGVTLLDVAMSSRDTLTGTPSNSPVSHSTTST